MPLYQRELNLIGVIFPPACMQGTLRSVSDDNKMCKLIRRLDTIIRSGKALLQQFKHNLATLKGEIFTPENFAGS